MTLTRVLVTILLLVWPITVVVLYSKLAPSAKIIETKGMIDGSQVRSVAEHIRDLDVAGGRPLILAYADVGPELLYRTNGSVMSIPSHRFQSGYRDAFDVMTAATADQAQRIVEERGIDVVLLYGSENMTGWNQVKDDTFRQQLLAGRIPAWLETVSLPDRDGKFLLFIVRQPKEGVDQGDLPVKRGTGIVVGNTPNRYMASRGRRLFTTVPIYQHYQRIVP